MLSLQWRAPWNTLEADARLELWRAGENERVFCFNTKPQRLQPYEHAGLAFAAQFCSDDEPHGYVVTFKGVPVYWSPRPLGDLVLRLYLHLPESNAFKTKIPHHVADALLVDGIAVPLMSHADVPWIDDGPSVYADVTFTGGRPVTREAYAAMITQWKDRMADVYTRYNFPDMMWLAKHQNSMHTSLHRMVITPPYQAIACAPVVSDQDAAGYFPGQDDVSRLMRARFAHYAGASAASTWRVDRGMGAMAATSEFLLERLRETVHLRGPRDAAAWEEERRALSVDTLGPQPADTLEEFCRVVQTYIVNPAPPKGKNRVAGELHSWAREAMENVVYALGAWCVTRRYVVDHRWIFVEELLRYFGLTDENTLGFTIPGDCEDSNSVLYYLALLLLLHLHVPKGTPLWYAKACLVAAGVPCCVSGSAQVPQEQGGGGASAPHLYGFFIPYRVFCRLVWGAEDRARCLAEMNARMGTQGCFDHAYEAAPPLVMEAILFTTPDYLDPDRWRQEGQREVFDAYHAAMDARGENVLFPRTMGCNWPLSLLRDKEHHGFIAHGRMVSVFTGAIPLLLPGVAEAHRADALMLGELALPATRGVDPELRYTTRFIAMNCVTDPGGARVTVGEGAFNNIGVPSTDLYRADPGFRLVSATPWTQVAFNLEAKQLLRYDRPFVPLRPINRDWCEDFRVLLRRTTCIKQPELTARLPAQAKNRFTVFVYADRLAEGAALLEHVLGSATLFRTRCLGYSLRPYCWAVAVVLHMNVAGLHS